MKGARHLGFDPVTYVRDDLVDFITLTPFLHDVPSVPVAAFRAELGNQDLPIYAGMMSNARSGPLSHGTLRAHAANAYQADADGLCLFNFFFLQEAAPEGPVDRGPARPLLNELGHPDRLEGRNKLYDAGCRAGYHRVDPDPVLPAALSPGRPFQVQIDVAEATGPASSPLLFVGTSDADDVSCEWNGCPLSQVSSSPAEYGAGRDAGDNGTVTAFALGDADLHCGANTVQLLSGDGGQLRSVELAVDHGPVEEHGRF
jgi:hypothetical protein